MKKFKLFNLIKNILLIMFSGYVLFLFGCTDEPTIVGLNNIYDTDLVNLQSFSSDTVSKSDITKKNVHNLGSYTQILIGKYLTSEASALVNFYIYFKDTVISTNIKQNTFTINSAKLKFYQSYKLGDTLSGNFRFNAFEIKTGWSPDSFTADSLVSSHFQYDQNNLDESFTSVYDSLTELNINKTNVLKWLESKLDTTKAQFQGIYLKSTATTNMIKGFRAFPSYSNSPITTLEIICEYASKIDTLIYMAGSDVHVVESSLITNTQNNFYIQPGVEFRSNFNFDTKNLSKNFIIIKAVMELQLDEQNSKQGSNSLDTLLVFRMIDSAKSSYDSTKYFTVFKKSNSLYSGDITYLIQEMLNEKNNQGFLFVAKDAQGRAELLSFYGCNNADSLKRPKIKITYAMRGK